MLDHAGMPRQFWAEAVAHTSDIRKRFFRLGSKNMTSYKLLIDQKPRIDHLRVFGSPAWVMIPKEKRKKLDVKSEEGVVIRCLENSFYKVWLRERQIALFLRDVRIDKTSFPARVWYATDACQAEDPSIQTLNDQQSQPASDSTNITPTANRDTTHQDSAGVLENTNVTEPIDHLTYVPESLSREAEETLHEKEQPLDPQPGVLDEREDSGRDDSRYSRRQRTQKLFYSPDRAAVSAVGLPPAPRTLAQALQMRDAAD